MAVMQDARVINEADRIAISETDGDVGRKCHLSEYAGDAPALNRDVRIGGAFFKLFAIKLAAVVLWE